MESESPASDLYCLTHPNAAIKWVCLDPKCAASREPLCQLCFGESHASCKKNMRVEYADIPDKVELLEEDFDDTNYYNEAIKILDDGLNDLVKQIGEQADASHAAFLELKEAFAKDPLKALDDYKQVVQIRLNPEDQSISVVHKLDNVQELRASFLAGFEEKLKIFSEEIYREIVDTEWDLRKSQPPKTQPSPGGFSRQKDFELKQNGAAFEISRGGPGGKVGALILDQALAEGSRLKVTVNAVNPGEPQLALGVLDSATAEAVRQSGCEELHDGLALWINGKEQRGFTGRYEAQAGFGAGEVVFLERKGDSVVIYNEHKTTDLVSKAVDEKQPLFFFLALKHKEESVTLEILS